MPNRALAHGVCKHARWGLFLANFHFIIMLKVVDKTRLPVSRRLGPFPEFYERKWTNLAGGWWPCFIHYYHITYLNSTNVVWDQLKFICCFHNGSCLQTLPFFNHCYGSAICFYVQLYCQRIDIQYFIHN